MLIKWNLYFPINPQYYIFYRFSPPTTLIIRPNSSITQTHPPSNILPPSHTIPNMPPCTLLPTWTSPQRTSYGVKSSLTSTWCVTYLFRSCQNRFLRRNSGRNRSCGCRSEEVVMIWCSGSPTREGREGARVEEHDFSALERWAGGKCLKWSTQIYARQTSQRNRTHVRKRWWN